MNEGSVSRKKEQLTVRVYEGLPEKMKAITPEGMDIGHAWSKAAELLLDLPPEVQLAVLTGQVTEPLVGIVERVVRQEIARGEAAGEQLFAPPPRKRGRKG